MDAFQILVWIAFYLGLYFVIFWLLTFVDKGIYTQRRKLQSYPLVTIGIPAWNEEKTISKTLHSVITLNYPHDKLEILVVNDGSTDSTAHIVEEIIKHNPQRTITLLAQTNGGKGKALNNALRIAKGEYFVCLDADSTVERDALHKMLPHFTNENIAVVLPLMKINTPKNFLQKLQWCEYLLNFFYKSLMAAINCVHVAPGPFSVYRKRVLQEVGGYAEGNLTEDFEVTLKIQKKHYKIVQLLDTEVYTQPPQTFTAFCKQRNRWYKGTLLNLYDYKTMIFNKKYGDFGMLQLPRVLLSGFLAVSFISLTSYRYVIKPLKQRLANWSAIHFDFGVFLQHFRFDLSWIDFNYTNLFFGSVSILLSLSIIYFAYQYSRERVFRYGFLAVPSYILLYALLASFVWLTVFVDLVRGKKQQW